MSPTSYQTAVLQIAVLLPSTGPFKFTSALCGAHLAYLGVQMSRASCGRGVWVRSVLRTAWVGSSQSQPCCCTDASGEI